MMDQVRCWTNIFTGQTGLDIALAFLPVADVTLLTSNAEHRQQFSAAARDAAATHSTAIGFQSHHDLLTILQRELNNRPCDGIFMTAAVSDYHPDGAFEILSSWEIQGGNSPEYHWIVRRVDRPKIKSTHKNIAFRGRPTEKIIDLFRNDWSFQGLLVKFKLEVDLPQADLVKLANRSRLESNADLIVANTLEMVHGENPEAWLIDDFDRRRVARRELSGVLRDYALAYWRRQGR